MAFTDTKGLLASIDKLVTDLTETKTTDPTHTTFKNGLLTDLDKLTIKVKGFCAPDVFDRKLK